MMKKKSIIFNNILYEHLNNNYFDELLYMAIKKGLRLAVLLDRTYELVFVLDNLFSNGIAFVPIDPNQPSDRIKYILEDSKVDIVVSESKYIDLIGGKKAFLMDKNMYIGENYFLPQESTQKVAYILYTSGTTGLPKGVEVTREAFFNFIEGVSEIIDFSPKKRIACLTTVSFDIFFLESIMALYKGLTVVLANEEEQRNPKLMANLIQKNSIDMVQMTPSRMQLLLNYDKELLCLKNVNEIMIGGEPFPLSLLQTLQEKTSAKIYNMYGPTEATIWSTISNLTHKNNIDIGIPIKNMDIYILDENLSVLPDGEIGEIGIAGKGLAKGYVGRKDLTSDKFVYLPQKPEIRIYRTGDIGRYLPNGDLEYLGRSDNQVKIRGHRIELEEIESNLNQFRGIKQSIVTLSEINEKDKVLKAFYTSDNNIDTKQISDFLSLKLPDYMIPVIYIQVESFIETTNGKIDRKRVLECVQKEGVDYTFTNAIANKLTRVQKKVLEVIVSNLDVSINNATMETFENAGVDSITFIKIVVSLEEEFDIEFDNEKLLITEFPTIKTMIDYVESKIKREDEKWN